MYTGGFGVQCTLPATQPCGRTKVRTGYSTKEDKRGGEKLQSSAGLPDFSWGYVPKREKYIPNNPIFSYKIYYMAVK
jgi:hypothetical protein